MGSLGHGLPSLPLSRAALSARWPSLNVPRNAVLAMTRGEAEGNVYFPCSGAARAI